MSEMQAYLRTDPTLTPHTVGYIIRGSEVLLGLRKRVSSGLGELLIAGIGGKLEPGETDEEALIREFDEEIKVKIDSPRYSGHAIYLFPHKPRWNQVVSIYTIDTWEGEPQETADIRPLWFPQDELPRDRMWPDNLHTIPRALTGTVFEGTFLYGPDGTIAEYEIRETGSKTKQI